MRIITIGMDTNRVYTGPLTACIGYFDGVHLGHRALIEKTIETAKQNHSESALITFDPDPWVAIKSVDPSSIKHITTFRERLNRVVELGIQNVVILKFTKEMSALESSDFSSMILGKLNLSALICGFDFHYGYKGAGDSESLKTELGIPVHVVPPVEDEHGKISSTRICQAIEEGNMNEVSRLLGANYTMAGTVVHGRHVGTSIGFPTANISYSNEYIVPKIGVYAGWAIVKGKKHMAMINIGHNPTFNYRNELSVEAHILDFNDDIYGSSIRIEFVQYLRGEKRFQSKNNLVLQLEQDAHQVRILLDK